MRRSVRAASILIFSRFLLNLKRMLAIIALIASLSLCGNNPTISNLVLTFQNSTANYLEAQFDLSWDNSWRTSSAPNNWDACWVFFKFQVSGGNWTHATINYVDGTSASDGHRAPSGSTITTPSDGKGVFIYRSSNGTGTVNFTSVRIRWNYGVDGVADNATLNFSAYAIEMVYIPTGSFYVGDGTSSPLRGQLEADDSGSPFQITNENSLTLGGTTAGNLGNNNASNTYGGPDDFSDATTQTLAAAYPKGYNDFYIQKHEMTQGQYTDFLNALTRTQQNARVQSVVSTDAITNEYVMSNSSTAVNRNNIICPNSGNGTTNPIVFSCSTPYRAMNRTTLLDFMAYYDWCGLRPLTELEFEKAARGPSTPVANEFAWGSTSITGATGISNDGTTTEAPSNAAAQCTCGDHASVPGVMRVGSYTGGSRSAAGASYYGVMDITGNVFDRCVALGDAHNRAFTGLHGNGAITAAGLADVTNWPSTSITSRGGSWSASVDYAANVDSGLTISDRTNSIGAYTGRGTGTGGRGARTAP